MNAETVSFLRCPRTHEALRLSRETSAAGRDEEVLVSELSGVRYAVRGGVPLLLDLHSVAGLNSRYQRFYNRAARFYDPLLQIAAALAGSREGRLRWEYLEQLQVSAGERVLEVSVGTGANLRCLPANATYYGLDISWGMLARCQRNLLKWQREAELFLGNAEELPFCDQIFDVVYHVGGINAFENRGRALEEMVRVARSGARLLVVDETAKAMEALSWAPSAKKMLKEFGDRFAPPVGLLPAGMIDVQVAPLVKGWLYCLTFSKP